MPSRDTSRRRRGAGCFMIDGLPPLAGTGEGVDHRQCYGGDTLVPVLECPSGFACRGKYTQSCAAAGGCSLGRWEPCRHAPGCFSLPPAWPVSSPDACPEACADGFFHASVLDPCISPGLRLGPPQCRKVCPTPPESFPGAYFRIECPPQITLVGLPCAIVPIPGYECSPKRAGCGTDAASIRCYPRQCRSNRTLERRAPESCPANHNPSVRLRRTCVDGAFLKPVCTAPGRAYLEPRLVSSRFRADVVVFPPPPPPSCCPSADGRASVWKLTRCVCVLAHLGLVMGDDSCCDLSRVDGISGFGPWSNKTVSRNTQYLPCADNRPMACTMRMCADFDGCYGFTRDSLLISNGSWVDGPTRNCRLARRLSLF